MVIMAIDIATGPDSIYEERVAPTPAWGSPKKFIADLRFYISERYGLKEQFITTYSWMSQTFFRKSPYPEVILGKDQFLFLGNNEALNSYQHANPLSDQQLNQWLSSITQIRTYFQSIGIEYHLIIAPNKHSIYGDYLPDWIKVSSGNLSTADKLLTLAAQQDQEIIDLRDTLREERIKGKSHVFYKTDTHWNEYGAFFGTQEIIRKLHLKLSEQPSITPFTAKKAGDLARMIGQQKTLIETGLSFSDYGNLTCNYSNGQKYERNQTDPIFPSPTFVNCKRNEPLDSVTNAAPRAVIFIDSFGVSLLPSLANQFSHSLFMWQYSINVDATIKAKPQYVIQVIAERKLETVNPLDLITEIPKTKK
jgi:hypothetical protein